MAERSSTVDQPTASDLRDERGGTRDPVTPPSPHPIRPATEQANERTPEGLQRKPSDPLNPSVGRSPNKPRQVP